MRELAGDPERRARLAEGGIATVAAYHPDVVATHVQRLYRDVIQRVGGGIVREAVIDAAAASPS
jgi:hypothetical protein